MCDIGVIPDNLVFTLNVNSDGCGYEYEITHNNVVFKLKDEGTKGYVIKLENSIYHFGKEGIGGYAIVRFKSFDEFLVFLDINTILHFLYCKKCGISTLLRKDERMFYHELK